MGWIYKYRWSFILLYFLPLCWMFEATLTSNFGVKSLMNSLVISNRGLFVVIFSLFGVYLSSRSRMSWSVRIGFILSFYMLFITFLIDGRLNLSLLSMLFFWSVTFYISEQNVLSWDDLRLIALIAAIFSNIMALDIMVYYPKLAFMEQIKQDQRVAASNSVYYLMSAFIFIFLVKNETIKKILMIMPCLAIMLVGKSTCLLAVVASVVFYFRWNLKEAKNKIWLLVCIVLLVVAAAYFSSGFINALDVFSGFNDDVKSGGNGRFYIWNSVIQRFVSSDLLSMFLGHGSQAVSKALKLGGHNDFVEMLYDYGLIGLSIYITFWISLIKRIKTYEPNSELQVAFIISLIVYAAASLFSNFINTQIQMLFFVMFWGFVSVQQTNECRT